MKRLYAYVIVIALSVFAVVPHASAHVLAENNGVSAVLHIPPFDAPEANKPINLTFQFGTDSGGFQIANYAVSVAIKGTSGTDLHASVEPPYFGAASEGIASVVFPKADVYDITLTGKPVRNEVPAFAMQYSVRVTGGAQAVKSKSASTPLYIGAVVFVVFVMFATRQIVQGGRYSKKGKKE